MSVTKRQVPHETKALVGIERLLAPLSPAAQDRVLTYFLSRVRDNEAPADDVQTVPEE